MIIMAFVASQLSSCGFCACFQLRMSDCSFHRFQKCREKLKHISSVIFTMNAAKSSHGMFITPSQTPNAKLTQATTSGVSSRRGTRKAKQAAKKDETSASLSAQQPAIGVVVSSDGKTRTVNGAMEYKSDMDGVSFQQSVFCLMIYC